MQGGERRDNQDLTCFRATGTPRQKSGLRSIAGKPPSPRLRRACCRSPAREGGVWPMRRRISVDREVPTLARRSTIGSMPASARSVLGRHAQARQYRARALSRRQAAGPGVRLRNGARRPHVRPAGQLRPATDSPAGRSTDRPQEAAVRDRRSSRRSWPGHRRVQGGKPDRRRHARRPSLLLRQLLSRIPFPDKG